MTERVRLLTLYPDELNIYADRGNLLFLRKRCEWRGIEFEAKEAGPGETFSPEEADLIYIGGGQYIHAPHTGDVVKISSIYRSGWVGAKRL